MFESRHPFEAFGIRVKKHLFTPTSIHTQSTSVIVLSESSLIMNAALRCECKNKHAIIFTRSSGFMFVYKLVHSTLGFFCHIQHSKNGLRNKIPWIGNFSMAHSFKKWLTEIGYCVAPCLHSTERGTYVLEIKF